TVNMWQGTKAVDKGLIEMADAFKASRSQVWRHIYIPHLTPFTFATARLAFTISWKLSLVAEIFGSNSGIGVVVQNYYQNFQTNMIIAWALPIMFLMLVIERFLQRMEHRAYRWRPDAEGATDMEMVE
ncbi:MAG: ABC transporter permease subunit, partial [Halobacteriales archaeon]|nr:ABC transporter permease subunit [Halobacteriales archaeon]